MSKCVFCKNVGVATITSTTPSDAFPFLCAQLGVHPGSTTPSAAALCSSCHYLWEEVSQLHSSMTPLLMGRRLAQFRLKLREEDIGKPRGKRGRTSRTENRDDEGGDRGPSPESLLSWWYPNSTSANEDNVGNIDIGPDVKTEPLDDMEEIVDVDQLMEMEDVEIHPENDDDDGQEQSDTDDDDPNYDPLASLSSSTGTSRLRNTAGSSRSHSANVQKSDSNTQPTKSRRSFEYDSIKKFTSLEVAKAMIATENEYRYHARQSVVGGDRILYLCKKSKKCSSRLCIYLSSDECEILKTNVPHDHVEDEKNYGIPQIIKQEIRRLMHNGTDKPKLILKKLRESGFETPTKIQLNNFLQKERKMENPAILSSEKQLEDNS